MILPRCSEALSEATAFPARQLASLVASKVYFHLGSHDEALTFALGAGKLFDVGLASASSPGEQEYVETIIGKSTRSLVVISLSKRKRLLELVGVTDCCLVIEL